MTMRFKFIAMTVALPMMALLPISVPAAEAELALLGSYVGSWRGEGALTGGDRNEPFRCRLTVANGNQGKINYSGRCTLVNATLSISGTIAYNDSANQYEAAMSSNAGFTGLAIGQQSGGQISFDLKERQKDRTGSDVRIGSRILLEGNDSITVDFEVEFNDSGEVLTASVPFSQ
ncbi:MAG: hypothetical protein JWQ22_1636 [Devosia sp.]|nr:hypothetical protein [Devosia sp.]